MIQSVFKHMRLVGNTLDLNHTSHPSILLVKMEDDGIIKKKKKKMEATLIHEPLCGKEAPRADLLP